MNISVRILGHDDVAPKYKINVSMRILGHDEVGLKRECFCENIRS